MTCRSSLCFSLQIKTICEEGGKLLQARLAEVRYKTMSASMTWVPVFTCRVHACVCASVCVCVCVCVCACVRACMCFE